ncbi:MAG TPA: 3-hydroxyacyl-CoA dehydrogenase NAD-binding domain-containing protein [Kineosporiaceae bacterium]
MSTQTETRGASTPAAPQEVVTQALVRDVQLPGGAGVMALITMDNGRDHTRPTSFGPGGLAAMDAALTRVTERAAAGEIVAVGLTGKPFFFCAGADLTLAATTRTAQEAEQAGQYGHAVFRRLGELGVPSFAFVNGVALGGGVEVALHCTYRTISGGVPALGLPEVFLGLIPGWGGTYLLPNLVGPAKALEIIIANPLNNSRTISGIEAHRAGIADAIFEPADFLEQSLVWAAAVLTGQIEVRRPEIDRDEAVWEAALAEAKKVADGKVNGVAPAPYEALDLVRLARTADRDAGFAAEDAAIARLILSPEFRSGLYAFNLVNKRAKRPAGAPSRDLARPVTSVGVVGAGLMASQMALLFARRLQVPVVLTDLDQERVDKGVAYVHGEVEKLLAKGRISADAASRLTGLVTGSTDKGAFAGADVVIEAVFERMDVKKQVFAEVEAVVAEDCILMTNTSSLSITEMAADLKNPERVVGFHFFNPVAVMPLVEIVKGERTSDVALATAFAVGAKLKKSCVLVKDAPAFVVNRLLTRFMGEVLAAVDAGTPPEVADTALDPLGLPMTPFTLLQLVGPAVALHTGETLHEAFPERFGTSTFLARIAEAGLPAVWSTAADGKPYLSDQVAALLPAGGTPLTVEQVRSRALEALAEEIGIMLSDGLVVGPEDIDLCMLLGAGWPFHLGGVTPYLDRSGIAERVVGRRFLPQGVASVPA